MHVHRVSGGRCDSMTQPQDDAQTASSIVGPDGTAVGEMPAPGLRRRTGSRQITDLVEQPGQGHADRHHDQTAARRGAQRAAGRGRPRPPQGDPSRVRSPSSRTVWPLSSSTSSSASRCRSPTTAHRPRQSCASRRRSWSAGSRDSSTASRPRCSPSRSPLGRSSKRCDAGPHCLRALPCPPMPLKSPDRAATAPTCRPADAPWRPVRLGGRHQVARRLMRRSRPPTGISAESIAGLIDVHAPSTPACSATPPATSWQRGWKRQPDWGSWSGPVSRRSARSAPCRASRAPPTAAHGCTGAAGC